MSKTASAPRVDTPPIKPARDRAEVMISEALEANFPCVGCARYTDNGQHFGGCPVNYRLRAMDFARALGLV